MKSRAAPVAVRRARAGDLDAVVAMRSALIESSRANPINRRLRRDISDVAPALFASQLDDPRCLTLIALDGECAIGMLRCMMSAANPLHEPPRHAYVLSVYVEPAHRRSGVLKALIRHADAWCSQQGAAEMRLHVGIENKVGNAAWKALGFQAAEVLRVRRIPKRRPSTTSESAN